MLQSTSVSSDSIKYTVQIYFDQPYYFSSEKIICSLKVFYEKLNQEGDTLLDHELLDYITVQLFGYASFSNEFLEHLNSNRNHSKSSINQFFNNLFNIRTRLDLLGISGKQNNPKNKPIFVSNPYILASDVRISKPKGDIGTFLYTCFLPPFIPPTFNGKLISFNYVALVTIGINNKSNLDNSNQLFNLELPRSGNISPIIQKKLKFNIKCLGPHPRSSGLLFLPIRKINSYHPITSLNTDSYHNPTTEDMDSTLVHSCQDHPTQILNQLNNIFQRRSDCLKTLSSKNDSSNSKMRFFELHDHANIYSIFNSGPKSLLEVYWENEISSLFAPKLDKKTQTTPLNNHESLSINYKGQLVAACKISNMSSWSSSKPIIIHLNFSGSHWKTQEVQIKIKRTEAFRQNQPDMDDLQNQTIIYHYKKCTLWDLEFSHQVCPLSSFLIPPFESETFCTYYQLSLDFFIYNTEKKLKIVNFLDVNRFPNLIKLSWNSPPITYFGQSQNLNLQTTCNIDNLPEISSIFHPIISILPFNNNCTSKSVDF
ncbi:hypothetical protein OJ253_807 [Cryptosporidium canis]|uniref:Uncharacterized protein n=1 Tax=Cryptosporidium canis TaxID=195482 RepID=A0A9D5DI48_9CRYT|nr:hypothetical protein OJ253_807 [Cryptosporidium canis]